jgi:hypothetical protein
LSPTYRHVWTVAIILAVALASAALVFSYLTVLSAESVKCAGHAWLAGYRSGVVEFFIIPLFSTLVLGGFLKLRALMNRESTIRLLATENSIIVLQFLSIRISYGMFGFIVVLLTLLFMSGMITVYCVFRYIEITDFCQSAAASG